MHSSAELRAIKWFTLTHALGLAAFVMLMGSVFWYLQHIERDQQRQTMYRDIEWAQQSLRLKWREIQDEVVLQSPQWVETIAKRSEANSTLPGFLTRTPEVSYLALLDRRRTVRWVQPVRGGLSVANRTVGDQIDDSPGYATFKEAVSELRPMFSSPFLTDSNDLVIELHVPVMREGQPDGVLVVALSIERSMIYALPHEIRERYQISLVDQGGDMLVSSSPRQIHDANIRYELPLDPPGHGVRLRAYAFSDRPRLIDRTLLASVIGLSIASAVSLGMLWRNARRRMAAEVERDRLYTLSLDPMAVFRPDGTFVRVNPAFGNTLGPKAKERKLSELVHPDDRERVAAALAGLQSGGGSDAVEFEARFESADGWRWLQWSVRGGPESSNAQRYAVAHDTTERKLAETTLAAETAFRRAMEDSILTGMRAFDMNGRITYVNRAFCQMVGLEASELIGREAPYPYWAPETYNESTEHLRMVLRGEAPASGFQVKVQRRDGTRFDARMYVSPLIDSAGRQTGWMTSMTDITEPTRIREELAAAHERFTTVLDELDAAVSVIAIDDGDAPSKAPPELLFANRFYRRMFGVSSKGHLSLGGRRAARDEWDPTEVLDPEVGRWFEVRMRRIRWVDGRPVQMLVATDVTRRREAEDQHRQQTEKLQQTARLITMGEMASSLAHELNQPLTAIANYSMGLSARVRTRLAAGLALDGTELLEMLSKTASQAERAGKVIRRIREFVKRSEPERKPCEVSAIVADAVGLAEIDAQRLSVTLKVELAPDLPTLQADPILIEQVLINLMKNGIDAMRDSARRTLHVSVIRRGTGVEFSVADCGQGMSESTREKLFEPFYTTKAEGMGMGLNICRSIVESHQGRLWVEQNPEGGCTFRFTVPLPAESGIARAA